MSSAFANMPAWVSSSVHISGSKYTWEALLRRLYFANVCSDRDLTPRLSYKLEDMIIFLIEMDPGYSLYTAYCGLIQFISFGHAVHLS